MAANDETRSKVQSGTILYEQSAQGGAWARRPEELDANLHGGGAKSKLGGSSENEHEHDRDGDRQCQIMIHSHAKGHTVHIMHSDSKREAQTSVPGNTEGIKAHVNEHIRQRRRPGPRLFEQREEEVDCGTGGGV